MKYFLRKLNHIYFNKLSICGYKWAQISHILVVKKRLCTFSLNYIIAYLIMYKLSNIYI